MDSIKYKSSMPNNFDVSTTHLGPNDTACNVQLAVLHPLKDSEANYEQHQLNQSLSMLRKCEGLAAPLKMVMEIQATKKVGHLPFLPSRNVSYEALTGRDEFIEFSDFLGTSEYDEISRQPHAVMEKVFKI